MRAPCARIHAALICALALMLLSAFRCSSVPVRAAQQHPAALPAAVTYVAIGASDAVGIGADNPDQDAWPAVLARRLPRGSKLINLGVPGITLDRALDVELPIALDALVGSPCPALRRAAGCTGRQGLVTVWLAVNDLDSNVDLDGFGANLTLLLHTLHTRTHATVLVGNLPDLIRLPRYGDQERRRMAATVAAWNGAIAGAARANGARLVDLYAGWPKGAYGRSTIRPYLSADGFHPNTAGYRLLAQAFWTARP